MSDPTPAPVARLTDAGGILFRAIVSDPIVLDRLSGSSGERGVEQAIRDIEDEARRADRPEARERCAFAGCAMPDPDSSVHGSGSMPHVGGQHEPTRACHPFRPEARVAEGLLAEMVGDYHQTGSIRDHVDPGATGWDVNKDWRICEDSLCVATREGLAALPVPRPPEPVCALCGLLDAQNHDHAAAIAKTGRPYEGHVFRAPRPPEPDRTADGQDVIDAINKAYWAGHDAAKAEPDRTVATVGALPEDWEATLFHAMMRSHRLSTECVECTRLAALHVVMKGLVYEVTPEVAAAIRVASRPPEPVVSTEDAK